MVNQSADVKITAYIGGTQLASLSKIVRVTIVPKPIETEKSWTWTLNSSSVTSTTATWNILTDLAPALGTTYAEFSAQSPTTVVTLSGSAVSNTGIEFVENPQYTLAIHINLSAASNLQLDKTYVITRTYFNSINGRTLVIKGTVVTKSPEITGINKIDRNWNSSKTIAYVLGQGSPWAPVGDLSSAYDFASASASGIGSVSFSFVKTNTAVSDYSVASSGAIQLLANQSGYLEGAQYAKVTLNASATVGGRLFTWPVPSQGFDVQFIRPLSVQKLAEASIEKNATSTSGNLLTYIKLVDERDGSNTSVAGITSKYQVTKIEAIGYDATLLTIAPATSANGFNPSIVLTNGYLANTSDITVEANVRVTYLNGGAMHTAAGILKVVVKARN